MLLHGGGGVQRRQRVVELLQVRVAVAAVVQVVAQAGDQQPLLLQGGGEESPKHLHSHFDLGDFADAYIRSDLQPFVHTVPHRRRGQPRGATASSSLGDTSTLLGGAGDQTSDLPVISQPALPPEQPKRQEVNQRLKLVRFQLKCPCYILGI